MNLDPIGPKVTDDQVHDFESLIDSPLPAEYFTFLRTTNGGRPASDTIVDIPGLDGSPTDLNALFGIGAECKAYGLAEKASLYSAMVEDGLLPIGCDSGGSLFLLSIREEDFGAVHFGDLMAEQPELHFIAESFDRFFQQAGERAEPA